MICNTINSKAKCCCLFLPRHLCHSAIYSCITHTSVRAIGKRRRKKKVCEGPTEEQVMTNISATKVDLTLERHGSSARKHAHEDPDYHEMTAL